MASHVPFLAVRPDDQFSTTVKPRDLASSMAIEPQAAVDSPPPVTRAPRSKAASKMSPYIRFPLVCVMSLGLSTLLYTFTSEISGLQFATASRHVTENWQIGALLGWKIVELFIAWVAGYDYEDLAALTLLSNQAYYYLLYSFWSIQLLPVFISLAIDVAIVAIPFALLRPVTSTHERRTKTIGQTLAMDWQILALTAALGMVVYGVTFYLSYQFNLGVFLISHFDNIPSLEILHDNKALPNLLTMFWLTGSGAMMFLFRPLVAASGKTALTESKSRSRKPKKFNPETATLGETFAYNLGYESGLTRRAEVLAKRTLVLAGFTLANTFVRVFGTVEGTDIVGSLGYGALWAGAHVLVALAYAQLDNEP